MSTSWVSQMRKGVIELVVLAALNQGEAYGYELLGRLRTIQNLALTESTVYPVLARLTSQKLLSVRRGPSPKGPPRRYYSLTPEGRVRLREMMLYWNHLNSGVKSLFPHELHEDHTP